MLLTDSNYNIWGYPRVGSSYYQCALSLALESKFKEISLVGELFSFGPKSKISGTFDERLKRYFDYCDSEIPYIFKIFPKQFIEKRTGTADWLSITDKIYKAPNTVNILLYREDLLDTLLSYLIMHVEGTRKTRSKDFYNSLPPIEISDSVLTTRLNDLRKSIDQIHTLSDRYKFDYIIKYEDLKGAPHLDFPEHITSDFKSKYGITTPLKMNSLKYKKKILPYKKIQDTFYTYFTDRKLTL